MSTPEANSKLLELKNKVSSLEKQELTGLSKQIDGLFMSDTQAVKKMISIKSPNMTDDDLNLLVYGRDLRKEIGLKYKPFESEKEVENEEDKEKRPKTKREKRKKEKELYKPISKDDPIFDEVKNKKTEIKHKIFLLEEKSKDLSKEVAKLSMIIPSTISASLVIASPPSFNIPGAITLTLSLLNSFTGIQTKLKDFIPLLTVVNQLRFVISDDKLNSVVGKIMSFVTIVQGISTTINGLKGSLPGGNLTEDQQNTKQKSLDSINKEIEETDKQLKNLNPANFKTNLAYESEKKKLEKKKERLSDKAKKLL